MNSINAITWNDLKLKLEDVVKRELRLSPNSKIDIKLSRPAAKGPGEINIQFAAPTASQITTSSAPPLTVAPGTRITTSDDEAFLLAAIRDAHEKSQYPFISLKWFKTTWLPALGAKFTYDEFQELITRLVANGEVVVEKIKNPYGHPVTSIRTPDMPAAKESRSDE